MRYDKVSSPEDAQQCQQWLEYCGNNGYYAKSYMYPVPGGSIIAVSTPESTNRMYANMEKNARMEAIERPAWADYHVYRFQGLGLMNFHGITDPQYSGMKLDGTLWDELQKVYQGQNRKFKAPCIMSGDDADSLREILLELRINVWLEITTGHSMLVYRGIDAYVKVSYS